MSTEHARPDLTIVVPTYNERDRLGDLVEAVHRVCRASRLAVELIVVDDHSPDGTGAVADALALRYPLRVIHRPGKLGLGSAVVDGFAVAASDIVGVMDGDLSHPPSRLPALVSAMRETGADAVVGSRYLPGAAVRQFPRSRVLLSRAACLLARGLTPVKDATSGFFLIRRSVAQGVRISAGGFKICLELLVRGRVGSVVEVPYVFVGRTAGKSKMNLREALGYLRQIRDLRRWQAQHAPWQAPVYWRRPGSTDDLPLTSVPDPHSPGSVPR